MSEGFLNEEQERVVGEGERERAGKLAERMVKSMFLRFVSNHNLPFTFSDVSVDEDVEGKIDFIISFDEHVRGVGTKGTESVGIQFTLHNEQTVLDQKKRFINRAAARDRKHNVHTVDDRVLVSIPMQHITDTVDAWEQQKKKIAGSPDMLWDANLQREVFTGVLKQLPKHLGIDPERLWNELPHNTR